MVWDRFEIKKVLARRHLTMNKRAGGAQGWLGILENPMGCGQLEITHSNGSGVGRGGVRPTTPACFSKGANSTSNFSFGAFVALPWWVGLRWFWPEKVSPGVTEMDLEDYL